MNEGKECLGFSILKEVFHVPPTVKNKLLSACPSSYFHQRGNQDLSPPPGYQASLVPIPTSRLSETRTPTEATGNSSLLPHLH